MVWKALLPGKSHVTGLKDYRMWFKLNCKTRISVVTSVGETDAARIFDSIGQGSFGAALALGQC